MKLVLPALALLLAAPGAGAQEPAFGFVDASLDAFPPPANAWADLIGGEVALGDDGTLRATIRVAFLPEPHPGIGYGVLFSDGTRDWYMALVTAPDVIYYFGHWVDGPDSSSEATGSYTIGPDGSVTIEMPVAALGNATELSQLRGLVADVKPLLLDEGMGVIAVDEAEGTGTLALPRDEPEPVEQTMASPPERADGPMESASVPDATAAEVQPAPAQTRDVPAPGIALVLLAAALALPRRWRA